MNLIADGPHTVEHFIGQPAHEMLSCVHAHVGVAGVPINRPNFVADFELMIFSHGVRYVAAAPNLRDVHVAVCSERTPVSQCCPPPKG